ncbi:hypothetical protein [Methylobacter sp. BlB1]|uniref:hypothetical protein n=1 Tax=Methylobacter sp. BlB1 TaxID=2785914 RepID=UPI001895AF24|nr:hypothetical protein [Methylobacter sp. BlB1]MBF6650297.1 hypothetical protein [Methylobacter sp. BlB1]
MRDVEHIPQELDAGAVFDLGDNVAMIKILNDLNRICQMGGQSLLNHAHPRFGLEVTERTYYDIYKSIEEMM